MTIRDLDVDDPRCDAVLPVLRELRPHLTADLFHTVYWEGHPQGLRFTAAFGTDEECLAVAGWRVVVNTSALRKLYVDDLVTAPAARSTGVGRTLLRHLETRGRELGCHRIDLDSGTRRTDAHRFYLRERMDIGGFHFVKDL